LILSIFFILVFSSNQKLNTSNLINNKAIEIEQLLIY